MIFKGFLSFAKPRARLIYFSGYWCRIFMKLASCYATLPRSVGNYSAEYIVCLSRNTILGVMRSAGNRQPSIVLCNLPTFRRLWPLSDRPRRGIPLHALQSPWLKYFCKSRRQSRGPFVGGELGWADKLDEFECLAHAELIQTEDQAIVKAISPSTCSRNRRGRG